MGDNNRFGEALRHAREAAGLRQEDLAELVSTDEERVTGAAIGNWERGENPPKSAQRVFSIEHALRLAPGELSHHLGFVPYQAGPPPRVEEALVADDGIDAEVRDVLLAGYRAARRSQRGR